MTRDDGAKIEVLLRALAIAPHGSEIARNLSRRVGTLLLAKAQREGVATERDRDRVREASRYLVSGGEYESAGTALESIGDHAAAADAYREGGLIHRMEYSLGIEEKRIDQGREVRDAFAGYQTKLRSGDRDGAREDLGRCLSASDDQVEYRRLLDELDARMLTGSRVALLRRNGAPVVICATEVASLGREDLCDLTVRAQGVSRRHSEILVDQAIGAEAPRFSLRDAGSRNGTLLGGLPVAGTVPLIGEGELGLGDECPVRFVVHADHRMLSLEVMRGLDRGARLAVIAPESKVALEHLGLPFVVTFRQGRPFLESVTGRTFQLNGEPIAVGGVQLVRDDLVTIGADSFEVA